MVATVIAKIVFFIFNSTRSVFRFAARRDCAKWRAGSLRRFDIFVEDLSRLLS
jgi:hypothetical protein